MSTTDACSRRSPSDLTRLSTGDEWLLMQSAVYHLLAENNMYSNITYDMLCQKGLEFDKISEVNELLFHHQFLKYFPHYKTSQKYVEKVTERNDPEEIFHCVILFHRRPMMKLNKAIVAQLSELCGRVSPEHKAYSKVLLVVEYLNGLNPSE